ncbi:unnamed protein product [Peniophora sp. CBMAI 1063]|nr:unnamed protein product [Peniophora sp. CBMAI 1063]
MRSMPSTQIPKRPSKTQYYSSPTPQSCLSNHSSHPHPRPPLTSGACLDANGCDPRAGTSRSWLCLPHSRTGGTLLGQVKDRVSEEHGAFAAVAGEETGGGAELKWECTRCIVRLRMKLEFFTYTLSCDRGHRRNLGL